MIIIAILIGVAYAALALVTLTFLGAMRAMTQDIEAIDARISRVEIERELDGEQDLTQQMMEDYRQTPMRRRES